MIALFRVDASRGIGNGHVARCRAFAAVLKSRFSFGRVIFACAEVSKAWKSILEGEGIEVQRISSRLAGPQPWSLEDPDADAQAIVELAHREVGRCDWVVVDHYSLDRIWEDRVRDVARKVLAIDDLANRQHSCDIVVDHNFDDRPTSRYASLVPPFAKQLIGPSFAMLRPEFAVLRRHVRCRTGRIRNIVILLGPADVHNVTGKTLEAIGAAGLDEVRVNVVLGGEHPHAERIMELARSCGANLHRSVPSMADLFANADLAVGAAGVTTLERICLRLPSLFTTVADNQLPVARALAAIAPALWLGPAESVTVAAVTAKLRQLSDGVHPDLSMDRMPEVDGLGADRIASEMLAINP